MKKKLLTFVFLIFLTTFALGKVRYNQANPENGFVHTNLDNRGHDQNLDGMSVSLFLPEFGEMMHSNSIDIDSGDIKAIRNFFWEDIPEGEHLVRVCAHNDQENNCVYRYFDFI